MTAENHIIRQLLPPTYDRDIVFEAWDPVRQDLIQIDANALSRVLPIYGGLQRRSNPVESVISGSSTDWSEAVQVSFNEALPSRYMTVNLAENHLEILFDGTYVIIGQASISGSPNDTISAVAFKNNKAATLSPRATQKLGSSNDVSSFSIITMAPLVAGDTVELWVQNESAAANVTFEDTSFIVYR